MLNMDNSESPIDSKNEIICRYCLDNNEKNLIHPCNCIGSSKYVHKECLLEWLVKSANRDIQPGYFANGNHICELCRYQYAFIETIQYHSKFPNKLYLFCGIMLVNSILFMSYLLIGVIASFSYNYFTKNYSGWNEIILNGILHTHFILGLYYLFIPILPKTKRPIWIKYIFGETRKVYSYILLLILGIILHPYYTIYGTLREKGDKINRIMILEIIEK